MKRWTLTTTGWAASWGAPVFYIVVMNASSETGEDGAEGREWNLQQRLQTIRQLNDSEGWNTGKSTGSVPPT